MEPKQTFIRTVGIALGIVVVLLGSIWYVKEDIDKKFSVVQELQDRIKGKDISLSELAQLQTDAERARQYAAQLDRLFTTKEQLLGFSTDIGFLSGQAGFTGTPKFKEETAPPAGDLQKTNFALTLEGTRSFGDLSGFFRSVEDSKYFVRFRALDVMRDGNVLRLNTDGYVLSFQ